LFTKIHFFFYPSRSRVYHQERQADLASHHAVGFLKNFPNDDIYGFTVIRVRVRIHTQERENIFFVVHIQIITVILIQGNDGYFYTQNQLF